MGRAAKPWFRAGRGWYCEHEGRQVCLAHGEKAETEAEARQAFHRLKAGLGGQNGQDLAGADGLTVGELIARFLAHSQAEHKPSTFIWYRSVLRWFLEVRRYQTAISIRPIDVAEWARGRGNSPNFRRNNIAAIKAVFEWGRKMGLISTNPIADTPKPPMRTRQVIPICEHVGRVLTATTGTPIGDLLVFLAETGCRLQDARRLTAADIRWEARLAILTEHMPAQATGSHCVQPALPAARMPVVSQDAAVADKQEINDCLLIVPVILTRVFRDASVVEFGERFFSRQEPARIARRERSQGIVGVDRGKPHEALKIAKDFADAGGRDA